MLPKDRMIAAVEHREADRVPVGDIHADGEIIERALGRRTYVHSQWREWTAEWEGRRDEVVASYCRDLVDLTRTFEWDFVRAARQNTVLYILRQGSPALQRLQIGRRTAIHGICPHLIYSRLKFGQSKRASRNCKGSSKYWPVLRPYKGAWYPKTAASIMANVRAA